VRLENNRYITVKKKIYFITLKAFYSKVFLKFFSKMSSAYCFLIQFILNFVGSVAADTAENNLFHGKHSDIPVPVLPTECMLEIFKHVQAQDSAGLYSCLLVNRYWCKNIVPLLWSRPFEGLSTENRYKLIRTYLACLDREDYLNLNSSLQLYGIKIPEIRPPLFNYPMCLEEFSYKQLEMAVHSTIHIWYNINHHKQDQILLITTTLCKLFMKRSTSLKSFMIDKYLSHSDIPQISTFIEHPGLSQLTRFKIDYCKPMTINSIKLLENLPDLCSNIRCLDIKLHIFEHQHQHKAISRIISTQKCLNEFNLSGVRIGSEKILFSLQSCHETLNIVRLENVYITDICFKALALCKNLKNLSLRYCRGLNIENTSILLKSKFSLKRLRLGFSPVCSDVAGLILQVGGNSLIELEIDLINPIIVETILNCCPNIKEMKLANYFPHDNNHLFYPLFHGLRLENLEIFINSKNLDYEDMKLTGQDLPPSLKYLKLSCGFTFDQFKELFKTCNAPLETIIIDYVDLNYVHIKVITKFIKDNKTVKTLGVVGMNNMTSQEIKELNMLKKRYGIFIIPSYELNQW
jgi:Leucine-rich repeat (LRR) protein